MDQLVQSAASNAVGFRVNLAFAAAKVYCPEHTSELMNLSPSISSDSDPSDSTSWSGQNVSNIEDGYIAGIETYFPTWDQDVNRSSAIDFGHFICTSMGVSRANEAIMDQAQKSGIELYLAGAMVGPVSTAFCPEHYPESMDWTSGYQAGSDSS